jgi:hypothetical protein
MRRVSRVYKRLRLGERNAGVEVLTAGWQVKSRGLIGKLVLGIREGRGMGGVWIGSCVVCVVLYC